MKVTKTNVLIISVALFLLVFPFAVGLRLPARRTVLKGETVIIDKSLSVYLNGNYSLVPHNGNLTLVFASGDSEDFREYFIENVTAIDSILPEVELNITGYIRYDSNEIAEINVKWLSELNETERAKVRNRIIDAFSNQWYTDHAQFGGCIVEKIYWELLVPPHALLAAQICWSSLVAFVSVTLIIAYWNKLRTKKKMLSEVK